MTNDIKQRYRDKGYRDKREYRDKDIEIIRITRRYPISYNLCRTSVHIHSYNSSVLMKLSKLNPTKANRPRGIPGCLLKEDANLFSGPIKQYWTLPTEAIFRSLGSLQISLLYQNRNLCKKKKKRKQTSTSYFTDFNFVQCRRRFCRRKHCKTSSSENELKATGLERFRNPQQLALMVALWGKWLHEENTKEKLIFYIKEVNAMLLWIRIILNPRSLMGSSVSWRLGSTSIPRTHSDSTVKSKHTDSHNRIILRPLFLIVQMLF